MVCDSMPIEILLLLAALLASSCWLSFAMLYHGMGHQRLAAPKAKTGKCLLIMTSLHDLSIDIFLGI